MACTSLPPCMPTQAYTTGKTPLEGLAAHLDSPWTTTVWQNDLARL